MAAALATAALLARAEVDFGLAGVQARYSAVERLDGQQVANSERGSLAGARLQLAWQGPEQRWGLSLSQLSGRVAYVGRSQLGFPIRSSSQIELQDLLLDVRQPLLTRGPLQVGATAALGLRRIHRRIAPTLLSTPLTETLDWQHAQIGLQADWRAANGWFGQAALHAEQGLGARLAVDFHGLADNTRVSPGHSALGHGLSLGFGRAWPGGLAVLLQVSQTRQAYGASAWVAHTRGGAAAGQLRYPGSSQGLDALQLGLSWALK